MKQDSRYRETGTRRQLTAVIGLLMAVMLLTVTARPLNAYGRVNINRAGVRELQELPYIGRKRAIAIVRSRKQAGQFRSLKELVSRKLIGQETFKAIENRITLYSSSKQPEYRPVNITNIHIDGSRGKIFMLENRNYLRALTAKIMEAQTSIRIVTFLFKTSTNPHNYASQLAEELIQAAKRGVRVDIILELSDYNQSLNESNRFTLERLRGKGIRIRFDSIKRTTHTKLVIVDDRFTFIGSHNLSHSALGINNELSLMIDSEKVAQQALQYLRAIE